MRHGRAAAFEFLLHQQKDLLRDNGLDLDPDPFRFWLGLPCFPVVFVEDPLAPVDAAGEDIVDQRIAPVFAPVPYAPFVQDGRDPLDAIGAIQIEVEYGTYDLGLFQIDLQDLLGILAARQVYCFCAEAEGWLGAVVIPLAGVLQHGPQGMFSGFLALIAIEDGIDGADHLTIGVIVGQLGDGDEPDPVLPKVLVVEPKFQMVPEKPGEAVHNDGVKGWRLGVGLRHHALKLRAAVVGGAGPFVLELGHHFMPLPLTPAPHLFDLVGDGQLPFSLLDGTDSGIQRCSHCLLPFAKSCRRVSLKWVSTSLISAC
ncbi:MAG TPA: hypothetical protein VIH45_04345 [Desulfuromonadaceae bacterium]